MLFRHFGLSRLIDAIFPVAVWLPVSFLSSLLRPEFVQIQLGLISLKSKKMCFLGSSVVITRLKGKFGESTTAFLLTLDARLEFNTMPNNDPSMKLLICRGDMYHLFHIVLLWRRSRRESQAVKHCFAHIVYYRQTLPSARISPSVKYLFLFCASVTSLHSITVLQCAKTGTFKVLSIIHGVKSRAHFVFALLKKHLSKSERRVVFFVWHSDRHTTAPN